MQVVRIDVHMHSPVHGSSGLRDMLKNRLSLVFIAIVLKDCNYN